MRYFPALSVTPMPEHDLATDTSERPARAANKITKAKPAINDCLHPDNSPARNKAMTIPPHPRQVKILKIQIWERLNQARFEISIQNPSRVKFDMA
jgi:hypothetical protein